MSTNRGPGLRLLDGERTAWSEDGDLRAAHPAVVGAEPGFAFQQVHEGVEVRRDGVGEAAARWQLVDECHRVLRPAGTLHLMSPWWGHVNAVADPRPALRRTDRQGHLHPAGRAPVATVARGL